MSHDVAIDRDWVIALPKAENHVHLEGCLDPDVVARAAGRAGVAVPSGPVSTLDELLHQLDVTCRLMTEPEDLTALAVAKSKAGDAVGAAYTDLILNPAHWPGWTNRLPELIEAIDTGLVMAEAEGSAPIGLSLSIGRHQSAADANRVADAIVGAGTHRVVGVSVDGNESADGAGCARFERAVNRVREVGLRVNVHTGESGGPEHMRRSIRHLRPHRIDHGIRSVEEPELVAELAASGVPLAICPTSNLTLGVVPSIDAHPIRPLREAGVVVTINTDDPLFFDTDLAVEYLRCAEAFDWGADDLRQLAAASVTTSSAPDGLRAELLDAIVAHPDPEPAADS
ncbi:MAG: adenosine deaminase [Actinomycetota bacterium]